MYMYYSRYTNNLQESAVIKANTFHRQQSTETADILTPADSRTRKSHSFKFKHLQVWAPAVIFPGEGGANLWGGPKKICEEEPPYFFRQALKYAYRGGGVVLMPAEFLSS